MHSERNHRLDSSLPEPTANATGNTTPTKAQWQRPIITRIDIKRTLSGTGTHADSISQTT